MRQMAQSIVAERERTGIITTYDENAYQGKVFECSLLTGRLD